MLRAALGAAGGALGAALLGACGPARGPALVVALAGVPGTGYVLQQLSAAIESAGSTLRVRVDASADWRPWVAAPAAPLPDVVATAAPGLLPALAGRLRDLSPVVAALTAAGDEISTVPWTVGGRQVALPLLYDPLLLLVRKGVAVPTAGQGFRFLLPGWRRDDPRVAEWDWNAFVEAVAAQQNLEQGAPPLDTGLPDTGPALALWLSVGWDQALAGRGPAGLWTALWADGLRAPDLPSYAVPTLPENGPATALGALLSLLTMAPAPRRTGVVPPPSSRQTIRFTHASTAVGAGGLRAGAALAPQSGWDLAPLPVLPGGPAGPGRFLTLSVAAGAGPEAMALAHAVFAAPMQVALAQSGWGLPATALGFLQWAMTPYACRFGPTVPPQPPGGERWSCAPLPAPDPVHCISPEAVFGARTAANAGRYDLVQADLLAALDALAAAPNAAAGFRVLTAAATAANAGRAYGAAEQDGVPFPGF